MFLVQAPGAKAGQRRRRGLVVGVGWAGEAVLPRRGRCRVWAWGSVPPGGGGQDRIQMPDLGWSEG